MNADFSGYLRRWFSRQRLKALSDGSDTMLLGTLFHTSIIEWMKDVRW